MSVMEEKPLYEAFLDSLHYFILDYLPGVAEPIAESIADEDATKQNGDKDGVVLWNLIGHNLSSIFELTGFQDQLLKFNIRSLYRDEALLYLSNGDSDKLRYKCL